MNTICIISKEDVPSFEIAGGDARIYPVDRMISNCVHRIDFFE
jgi:hypothetical protein